MKKSYNQITELEKDIIVNSYYDEKYVNFLELSNILNISERALSRILKEKNINTALKNKYTVNQSYFDIIDSERKAYWLGFIYADGYVGDEKANNIVLSSSTKDIAILESFKKDISYTGNIRKAKNSSTSFNQNSNISVINFSSKQIAMILREKYNIIPYRKEKKFVFPNIPKDLIRHFVRGYFDGDGSVWCGNKNCNVVTANGEIKNYSYQSIKIDIIGNISLCQAFAKEIGINGSISDSKTNYLKYLSVSGKDDIKIMFEYLYKQSTIYLERKFVKFNKINEII